MIRFSIWLVKFSIWLHIHSNKELILPRESQIHWIDRYNNICVLYFILRYLDIYRVMVNYVCMLLWLTLTLNN